MRGRKGHKPDDLCRRFVRALTAHGATRAEVAAVIGISVRSLRRHYADELAAGDTLATTAVASNLHRIATSKAKRGRRQTLEACIFWLKARHPAFFVTPER